jgi:hypothetical protein
VTVRTSGLQSEITQQQHDEVMLLHRKQTTKANNSPENNTNEFIVVVVRIIRCAEEKRKQEDCGRGCNNSHEVLTGVVQILEVMSSKNQDRSKTSRLTAF